MPPSSTRGENPGQRDRGRVFTAPLGSAISGRLVFTAGATGVTIVAEPALQGLVRGRFLQCVSWVGFERGIVKVGYHSDADLHQEFHFPRSPLLKRRAGHKNPGDELGLNASIPWEIEFHGRTSDLNADLRGLELRSLDLLGGANRIRLLLSRPAKTTFIYITGGIHASDIRMQLGVGLRVQISDSARDLVFESQRYATIDGETSLENAAFKNAATRCEICITGRVSHLTIDEQK